MAYRILVVDDEEALCQALQFNLEIEGYTVDIAYSAEQALTFPIEKYSLILLDVMMGEMSGFKMAQRLKSDPNTAKIPIIFCTAKDQEDDMIAGLNLGADDYITKPYTIRNILARTKSVLRRTYHTEADEEDNVVSFEGISLHLREKKCKIDGIEIKLTRKEFEILSLLLKGKGRVFSREEILKRVWGDDIIVCDRTIDVNITRLRGKLGNYGERIITRTGYGYAFEG